MATATWPALYLGWSSTFLDPVEGDTRSGNASQFVGRTFGSAAAPLADNRVLVTATDVGGTANVLDVDNTVASDTLTYDIGNGPETHVFDGAAEYTATITYLDGTTATVSAIIAQDSAGNLFLLPELGVNADTLAYERQAIRSITLNSLLRDTAPGAEILRHQTAFICFAAGTLISTASEERPVENLAVGDEVVTLDHGPEPIRWIAHRTLPAQGTAAPVRISSGALGGGLPRRDLLVSPQHRLLVRSTIAERMFGTAEILVPARRLCTIPGIGPAPRAGSVRYVHFAFRRHEIVLAEGAPAESLYPGVQTRHLLGNAAWSDLLARLGPADGGAAHPEPARPFVQGPRLRQFCERHVRNARPLLAPPTRTAA